MEVKLMNDVSNFLDNYIDDPTINCKLIYYQYLPEYDGTNKIIVTKRCLGTILHIYHKKIINYNTSDVYLRNMLNPSNLTIRIYLERGITTVSIYNKIHKHIMSKIKNLVPIIITDISNKLRNKLLGMLIFHIDDDIDILDYITPETYSELIVLTLQNHTRKFNSSKQDIIIPFNIIKSFSIKFDKYGRDLIFDF